jgi:hypothetical protein
MYSIFLYIKIDPQYYFFRIVLDYYFFPRLLEIKKYIEGVKCRFLHKRGEECNSSFSWGRGVKSFLILDS